MYRNVLFPLNYDDCDYDSDEYVADDNSDDDYDDENDDDDNVSEFEPMPKSIINIAIMIEF